MKKTSIILCFIVFYTLQVFAAPHPVRVKDIAHVLEAKENQLMGFGLVIGLKNSGDSIQTEYTKQALTNLLSRIGIAPLDKEFKSRNIAAVMVTAKLPPFVKVGQKIDVTVSSLGDATSLQGGTLLMTPLQGADDNVYAVAQGAVALGMEGSVVSGSEKKQTNVGRIVNGGIVEKEVPVSIAEDFISIVIERPDYTTASRIADAMTQADIKAKAMDAATVIASKEAGKDMVDFISSIENLIVIPDSVAKIVVNEQTGVIVMGENVRIAPVAISYSGISIVISSKLKDGQELSEGMAEISGASLSELISALNAVGVRPKDLIAILQAIKSSGAISADIEVI